MEKPRQKTNRMDQRSCVKMYSKEISRKRPKGFHSPMRLQMNRAQVTSRHVDERINSYTSR